MHILTLLHPQEEVTRSQTNNTDTQYNLLLTHTFLSQQVQGNKIGTVSFCTCVLCLCVCVRTWRKRRTVDLNPTVHGSVLRHSLLKGISAQIVSAAVRLSHTHTHTHTVCHFYFIIADHIMHVFREILSASLISSTAKIIGSWMQTHLITHFNFNPIQFENMVISCNLVSLQALFLIQFIQVI